MSRLTKAASKTYANTSMTLDHMAYFWKNNGWKGTPKFKYSLSSGCSELMQTTSSVGVQLASELNREPLHERVFPPHLAAIGLRTNGLRTKLHLACFVVLSPSLPEKGQSLFQFLPHTREKWRFLTDGAHPELLNLEHGLAKQIEN